MRDNKDNGYRTQLWMILVPSPLYCSLVFVSECQRQMDHFSREASKWYSNQTRTDLMLPRLEFKKHSCVSHLITITSLFISLQLQLDFPHPLMIDLQPQHLSSSHHFHLPDQPLIFATRFPSIHTKSPS